MHIIVFDWIVFETYRYRILGCWSSAQDTMSGNAKKGRDEFVGGMIDVLPGVGNHCLYIDSST